MIAKVYGFYNLFQKSPKNCGDFEKCKIYIHTYFKIFLDFFGVIYKKYNYLESYLSQWYFTIKFKNSKNYYWKFEKRIIIPLTLRMG